MRAATYLCIPMDANTEFKRHASMRYITTATTTTATATTADKRKYEE